MEIRDFETGDENAICDLFKIVFRRDLTLAYWDWRYNQNPFFKEKMIKLMWDDDKLIGHYALSPVILIADQDPILAALSMTTMVHPQYEGMGILAKLAENAYTEYYEKHNLRLVYGFPNKNSHYSLVKFLKWTDIHCIPTLSLSLEAFHHSSGKTNDIKVGDIAFDTAHLSSLSKTEYTAIKIDADYLTWRYAKNPVNTYHLFTLKNDMFAITKVFKSFVKPNVYEVDILELSFSAHYGHIRNLLTSIVQYYSDYDIWRINCWTNIEKPMHLVLERIGFINSEPITYFGMRALDDNLSYMKKGIWNYSMGMSDIY